MGKREKPREKKIFRVIMALIIWLAVIAVFAAAFWNGLTATLYEIKFPDLPEPFDGYTIVHLSDLHGARFGENQSRLIRRIDRTAVCLTAGSPEDLKKLQEGSR